MWHWEEYEPEYETTLNNYNEGICHHSEDG